MMVLVEVEPGVFAERPLRGTRCNAGHLADVGNAQQAHNRFVTNITEISPGGIGTILLPPGVYDAKFKIEGGNVGDEIWMVLDAAPVDDDTDVTQAAAFLTTAPTASADGERFTLTQGGADSVNGLSLPVWESKKFDASSEGVRRLDFLAAQAGNYSITMELP